MGFEQSLSFKRLKLYNWRQFASVDIEFHPRLTIITGANGAGKSSLINILSRHMGAERPYYSIPRRDEKGAISFIVGQLSSLWATLFKYDVAKKNQIGEVEYSNAAIAQINVPEGVGLSYSISVSGQLGIPGAVIGSHRLLAGHQRVDSIPFEGVKPENVFGRFQGEAQQRYIGNFSGNSLIFQIKQTLAAWAAIGEGNSVLQPDSSQKVAFEKYIEMLKMVLPESLGFETLAIRPPEVVMVTKTGEFIIDAASGGITTIIEMASLIYACTLQTSLVNKTFVVTIDEPENHLHPSLQRSLIPSFVKAFPQAQFIVATHSPFIVSSLKDSNVYVLRYRHIDGSTKTDSDRIVSEKLDYGSRAGNASEILREVLGLGTTLPQWVERDLESIVERYQAMEISDQTIKQLKLDLADSGLAELFPEAIAGLSRNDKAN